MLIRPALNPQLAAAGRRRPLRPPPREPVAQPAPSPRAQKPRVAAQVTPQHSRNLQRFDRPIFIVSSPRSGTSLLFETLAQSPGLLTIGGESHA